MQTCRQCLRFRTDVLRPMADHQSKRKTHLSRDNQYYTRPQGVQNQTCTISPVWGGEEGRRRSGRAASNQSPDWVWVFPGFGHNRDLHVPDARVFIRAPGVPTGGGGASRTRCSNHCSLLPVVILAGLLARSLREQHPTGAREKQTTNTSTIQRSRAPCTDGACSGNMLAVCPPRHYSGYC